MNDFDSDLVSATIRHAPLFLACIAGLILACVFWRRHPLSAGLALAGSLLFGLGLGTYLVWEFGFFPELDALNDVPEGLDELILYGTPYLQGIGLALILIAAFVGRRERFGDRRTFDDD